MAAARAPSPRPERDNKDGGTKLDPINEQFRTACDSANLEEVKRLLRDKRIGINMKDPRGWVSLHDAANAASMASSPHELLNALEIIKLLLKTGADPRIATRSENTTFHLLGKVQVPSAKEWEETRKQLKATLQSAFEKGAEINYKNTQGITPLHEAAFRGAAEASLFFLQHNADPNLRTLVGETALHYAVRAQKEECVRMLLAYRADPNLKSEKSSSLDLAQELGLENIKKIITDFIANPKYEDPPKVGGLLTLRTNRSQQTLPVGLPGEPASPSAANQSTEDIEDVILVKTLADIPRSLLQRLQAAGIPQEAMLEDNCEQICRILKTNDKQLDIRYLPQNSDTDLWSKEDPKKLFKEIEVAGKGGFGRVFYAQKLDGSNFRVAIKKMDHVTRRERRRNTDEVLALRDYRHSNIVQYIAAYKLQKEVWVVMEFMEGGTLEQAIIATKFPEDQIAYIMKEILRGLAFLHSKSRAHRDIKSANVMLTIAGNVKLIDLGLSADMSLGPRTDNCGSPFWLPPEMILDKPHTLAVDIWSFGITMIESANGAPPNRAAALKAVWDVALSPSPTIDGMACDGKPWSAEMKEFLAKALVKDPTKRATSTQLLEHAWLNRAMSRKDIGRVFQRVFMVKQLDKMGFGF